MTFKDTQQKGNIVKGKVKEFVKTAAKQYVGTAKKILGKNKRPKGGWTPGV